MNGFFSAVGPTTAEETRHARALALGWNWVGRVRSGVCIGQAHTRAIKAAHWFARATGRATRWHDCTLTARYAWPCDLVPVRRRRMGRKHYARSGRGPSPKARAEARALTRLILANIWN